MTYCLGICVDQGLVLASDSRTSAGVDYASLYSKMHVLQPAPDRLFVVLSAGNLALSQQLLSYLERDLAYPGTAGNLNSARYLFEAAEYIGATNLLIQNQHGPALRASGQGPEVTLILGGQIDGEAPGLFIIYPQGNYMTASAQTPFLQIGEIKYGKPMLDRVARPDLALEDAAQLSLVSLDGAARSNISVGPPYEVALYQRDSLALQRRFRFEGDDPFLSQLSDAWHGKVCAAFQQLPRFQWS
ncbi:MAG TPA: peptidase [Porticoccaceae bacterium]|nr:peptidase [Porticoccaceae bacterium]